MKLLAIIIMLIALYLLYRIAYPKQASTKKDNEIPTEKPKSLPDVMGKSRFVLPDRSKPLPLHKKLKKR
jgi:Ca2+/Na+ antiporter